MSWVRTGLLALALLAPLSARAAAADTTCHTQRLALVIGNAAYTDTDAPLREPIGGAREFADALQRLGFATTEAENLTGDRMRSLISEFEQKVTSDSVAMVFFSGFGLQSGGHTYLIPVDATIWNEQDIKTVGFNLDRILSDVASRGARLRLVVVDGARHNPYERRFRPAGSLGMAAVNGTPGLLALYSSLPGTTFDESGGNTSPFVDALITAIGKPGAKAEEAFRRARADASRVYRGSQTPWVSSFLDEDLPFEGGECSTARPATAEAAPPPPASTATPAPAQSASAPAPQKNPPPRPAPPVKVPARPASPGSPPTVVTATDAPPPTSSPPVAVTPSPTPVVVTPPPLQPVAVASPPPPPIAVTPSPSQPALPTPAPPPSPAAAPEVVKTQPTAQVAATPTPPPAVETPPPSPTPASPPHVPEQVAVEPRPQPVAPEPVAAPKPAPRQQVAISVPPPPPIAEDPGDERITDSARLKEIADRLFDRDFNPGEPGSAEMRAAILDYERQAGLPMTEQPTVRLLSSLRSVPAPAPWGAIAISKDHEKVGTSWNEDTRRAALSDARAHCGPDCVAAKGFYGHQCAALAKSPVGWSIASGDDETKAHEAALSKCNQFGVTCEIRRALCADGSGRLTPTKTP